MKILNYWLLGLGMLLAINCTKTVTTQKQEKDNAIPVIDVTKSYPKKEIVLQDIADVEYIPLETRDDVLFKSTARIAHISKNKIIIYDALRGNIFVFDGKGKILSKFNHSGQGAREYLRIRSVFYNPPTQELFVLTRGKPRDKFLLYDIQGKFKREIPLKAQESMRSLTDFDTEKIIAYEKPNFLDIKKKKEVRNKTPMFLISKRTGKIDTIKEFYVPNRQTDYIIKLDSHSMTVNQFKTNAITKLKNGFVLDNFFNDTVFVFNKNKHLTPILLKEPAFETMSETPFVLELLAVTPRYFFGRIMEHTIEQKNKERAKICIDRVNKSTVAYTLRNTDINDNEFKISPHSTMLKATELTDLLEDGKLKGKLKKIAENLKEDDNPVLMKVTFKK